MLYIHKLSDLTPKSAELESVYLVRDIRNKRKFPLRPGDLDTELAEFLIAPSDLEAMKEAQASIFLVREFVKRIMQENNPLFEAVNMERTSGILDEISLPLQKNQQFAEKTSLWQDVISSQFTGAVNSIPNLRTEAEKQQTNAIFQNLFSKILRNEQFGFAFQDIVNEAHTTRIQQLDEGMEKGFLFHISLEEELTKASFEAIKSRIPSEILQRVDDQHQHIKTIRRGIERAYGSNKRLVNLAVVMYSYIRWAQKG
ncbi:MAG: hypothetical protein AB1668_02510 [Nanoarchaeota archaeon]